MNWSHDETITPNEVEWLEKAHSAMKIVATELLDVRAARHLFNQAIDLQIAIAMRLSGICANCFVGSQHSPTHTVKQHHDVTPRECMVISCDCRGFTPLEVK